MLLSLRDFSVSFESREGMVRAVDGLSLDVEPGERLAVVGESGSGKSQTFLALMGLLARNGHAEGEAMFEGRDLLALSPQKLDRIRGREIAMIFQDPMTSLNPTLRISTQLTETLSVHQGLSGRAAATRAIEMLERVGIPDAARRFRNYPHELSGGMRQRVMIAMGLLCGPKLLIADEPTTALDVTIQAQVLELFNDICRETGAALILITHDLGVVAEVADRVMVMYGGRAAEIAPTGDLFTRPGHPYTAALLASSPRPDIALDDLNPIAGRPPNMQNMPPGCAFAPRCAHVTTACHETVPPLESFAPARASACLHREGFMGGGA